MFTFLFIITLGAVLGYALRNYKNIGKIPNLLQIVICTLLFLLGISVGGNKEIIHHFSNYCGQAVIIALLSLLGSVLAALLLDRFFTKKKNNER